MAKEKDYKSLKSLGKSIAKACADLEKGTLGLDGIKAMLLDIREIEERAIILNYKAIEKIAKGEVGEPKVKTKSPETNSGSLTFRFDPIDEESTEETEPSEPDNQISLIDSIQEIKGADQVKKEPEPIEPKKEPKKEPAKEPTQKPVNEPAQESKPKKPIESPEKPKKKKDKKTSINDEVKAKSKPSLAQKLSKKPIDNINKALNVNARIGIVKELFKGDADLFKAYIEKIENCGSLQEAQDMLDQGVKAGNWKEDGNSVTMLKGLIERRFST
jgi:hypothetical protein